MFIRQNSTFRLIYTLLIPKQGFYISTYNTSIFAAHRDLQPFLPKEQRKIILMNMEGYIDKCTIMIVQFTTYNIICVVYCEWRLIEKNMNGGIRKLYRERPEVNNAFYPFVFFYCSKSLVIIMWRYKIRFKITTVTI